MKLLNKDDIVEIVNQRDTFCVSMYMPTYRVGNEVKQNPIRFKNLIGAAEEQLIAAGMRPPTARSILQAARNLLLDSLFWQQQSDALAVFLMEDFFRYFRIPIDAEEIVVVTDHFHVKPLLSLLTAGERFFILALSQNDVRFFHATPQRISEVIVKNMPRNIDEALAYDEPEKQLQHHGEALHGKGERAASFHGHGVGIDDTKSNISRFCHKIDNALHHLIRLEKVPLIVAAVEPVLSIFKEVSKYPNALKEYVSGNHQDWTLSELHDRARKTIEPYFQKDFKAQTERLKELLGTPKASNNINEIIKASFQGRIDVLLVAMNQHIWGVYEPDTDALSIHDYELPGDEDLLDFIAIQTLLHQGTVYSIKPHEIPDGNILGAIFRY